MLKLQRVSYLDSGVFGYLFLDGSKIGVTLEHSYNKIPKIPLGEYICIRGQHSLHSGPIETFEVTGVVGHSGILFHYGNYNSDSDGCILVGESISGDMITNSRATFAHLIDLLSGQDSVQLQVSDI